MKKDEVYFTSVKFPENTFDFGKVKEGDTFPMLLKFRIRAKSLYLFIKQSGHAIV
jgi:hypothetical protein